MGFAGIPFFLQVGESFSDLVSNAGVLAKSILIILLVLSVVSWTVMVEKFRFFRRAARQSRQFLSLFNSSQSLKALAGSARELPECPEARMVAEITADFERGELGDLSLLDNYLETHGTSIVSHWESYLIFLATTATVSPFLGLLGTVWGIMRSFLSMGVQASANLYVVGPGIAEALITTIFGLGAAIPAVVGYNYIIRKIRSKEDELMHFSARFRSRLMERRYGELSGVRAKDARDEGTFTRTV
jgi:biopolymer transport protein TolQ